MTETNRDSGAANEAAFLAVLRKSGLVSVEQLDAAIASDVLPVARYLIDANLITRWQYEKLVSGRYKGFYLGKYRLLDHLGTGGMSTVYLAEHSLTGQKRAIKVLPRTKTAERSYLARFYREGRAVAALHHPNIVRIYDIAVAGETHYMVMDFIEGSDLFDIVNDQGPLEFDLAHDCIVQTARGLSHAHEKNLIHRDIKPANLFRTVGGIVKVLDLGLALLKSEDDDHGLSKQYNEQTMGTADYLAPEQAINSHDVDPRADIYSLGCTLFFLLTGRPPFNEGTLAQRIAMHQAKAPPEIGNLRPDCPEYLIAVCNRMMQKDADLRFQDCDAVIAALEARAVPRQQQNRAPASTGRTVPKFASPESGGTSPSTMTPAARKRTRYPWGPVALIAVLAIVPIVLAIIAFSLPTGATVDKISEVPGESADGRGIGFSPVARQRDDPNMRVVENRQRTAGADPNSTALTVQEDFELPARFPDDKKSWDLITADMIVGTLFNRGKCRVVNKPESSPADVGQYCLQIAGDSVEVEFRPEHPDARIDRISFLARRVTDSKPMEFEIEAKSNRQFERWKRIHSATDSINDREFNEVVVEPEQMGGVHSQKFRFKLVGDNQDNGVYIDNLKIELK